MNPPARGLGIGLNVSQYPPEGLSRGLGVHLRPFWAVSLHMGEFYLLFRVLIDYPHGKTCPMKVVPSTKKTSYSKLKKAIVL